MLDEFISFVKRAEQEIEEQRKSREEAILKPICPNKAKN